MARVSDERLHPCPECGAPAVLCEYGDGSFQCECTRTGYMCWRGPENSARDEAVSMWNMLVRAPDEREKFRGALCAEQERAVRAERERDEALALLRECPSTHEHFDALGTAGVNCPACVVMRAWRERAQALWRRCTPAKEARDA